MMILSWILMGTLRAKASVNSHLQEQVETTEHDDEEMSHQSEEIHHEEAHHEMVHSHSEMAAEHETSHSVAAHSDDALPTEAPLIYLFYWGILILIMVIILIYFVYRFKRRPKRPIIPLAVFLVIFVVAIYGLEILTPTFSGKFDLATLRIIAEFHESANLGFMRFIYKFLLGIFLTIFAFLNMDRKRYESTKEMED